MRARLEKVGREYVVVITEELAEALGGTGAEVEVTGAAGRLELELPKDDERRARIEAAIVRSFEMHGETFRKLSQ